MILGYDENAEGGCEDMSNSDRTGKISADDWLEPADDGMYHPATEQTRLPENHDTPAQPLENHYLRPLPPGHPLLDSHPDEAAVYDEGLTGESGVWVQHEANDRKNDALHGKQ